jgi:hypothetical protein
LGVSGKVGTVMIAITGSFFLVSELVRRRRGGGRGGMGRRVERARSTEEGKRVWLFLKDAGR